MKKNKREKIICTVTEAIELTKKGQMLILVDDRERENEGDLFIAAQKVTAQAVNFMITYGKGLVCVPLTRQRARKLSLPLMVKEEDNQEFTGCNFTVSVDAKDGVSTGISAHDRARTIKLLADANSEPTDFVRPGHVFPLVAQNGGLIARKGHTEAAVALARWSGQAAVGVICELISSDGRMMRLPEMISFAKKHNLKIVFIQDLIAYQQNRKNGIDQLSESSLLTSYGKFTTKVFVERTTGKEHLVLIYGHSLKEEDILVRVHSQCLTGEVFGSLKCDCQSQLRKSLEIISKNGSGVIIYLNQEGRGIGLANKIKAYYLQERGLDTVEANKVLGFAADERDFKVAAQILKHLGLKRIKMLTNNPVKVKSLRKHGILVTKRLPLQVKANKYDRHYLKAKKEKLGQLLEI